MSLVTQISETLKEAMKARDIASLEALRALKSALKYAVSEMKITEDQLTDMDVIGIVRKQIKQRQESAQSFHRASRTDLAEKEEFEIGVLKQFLPEELTPEALTEMIQQVIAELGATSKKDLGSVIKRTQELASGRAEPRAISQTASSLLS